jgi:peptidoglycan/xylan/chitin deacetylase (PgdA/CDA1 family)
VKKRDWKRLTDPGAVVLMYHSISPRGAGGRYVIPRRRFSLQMRLLLLLKRRVLPLEGCVALWEASKMTPPRTVAITFDDGYRDNLTEALPVLRKYDLPAAIFVVAGKVGGENDWEDLNIARKPILSWDELALLEHQAHQEHRGAHIESHGMEHLKLTTVAPEVALRDMRESRVLLSRRLGREVRLLAYPYGSSNPSVESMAKEAGYAAAVTVRPGMNTLRTPRYRLKRVEISGEDSLIMFVIKVLLGEDPFTWIRQRRKGAVR